jgi:hypothetical protein
LFHLDVDLVCPEPELKDFRAGARMSQSIPEPNQSDGLKALSLLESALEILDAIGAPGHIGARVDFAICALREILQAEHNSSGE